MISIKRPVSGDQFINRLDLLGKLKASYPVDNVVLVGPRRIGKSSIAEQFLLIIKRKNTIRFRFDVQENIGTPGKFGIRLLRLFLISYFEQLSDKADLDLDEMEINRDVLIDAAERIRSKTLLRMARYLISYFPPAPEHERAVLERILQFLDDFAEEMGVKAAIVLDEFQAVIALNKYKDFRNGKLLGFLQAIISRQRNIWYMFTGSAVRLMINILEDKDSPFYGRVKRFNVGTFGKDDTAKLVQACLNKPITAEALDLLFSLSKGHPFYTIVIIQSANQISAHREIVVKFDIEAAFISELSEGVIDSHCSYLFDTSLERASYPTLLKEILRELTAGEVTMTELAGRIGRSTGYISAPLRNLYQLDLIDKRQKKYFIADNILKMWIQTVYGHNDPNLEAIKKNIRENYQEYIAALSTETGVYFESYLREMLQKFNGQIYAGVRLPKFGTVYGLNAFDTAGEVFGKPSNIEIDALCLGKENWICEFKYQKKSVSKKDIDQFVRKKEFIAAKLNIKIDKMMYVAKSGFSEYALNSDVWCVTLRELDDLLAKLNMRTASRLLKPNKAYLR